jgi:hypothetical protein
VDSTTGTTKTIHSNGPKSAKWNFDRLVELWRERSFWEKVAPLFQEFEGSGIDGDVELGFPAFAEFATT